MSRAAASTDMRSQAGTGSSAPACTTPRLSVRRMSESTNPGEINVTVVDVYIPSDDDDEQEEARVH